MRKLWNFHGGIEPPERKNRSVQSPIRQAGLPQQMIVPLHQHAGVPAQSLVAVGDEVAKGAQIAAAQDGLSVAVHAPTSGRIAGIEPRPVAHPSGLPDWCIILEPDGEERWAELDTCLDYKAAEPSELLIRIRDAGIAGLGGAGFPTAAKLQSPGASPVRTLILNGAECEPYITADQILMQERADDIVAGYEIMAHILKPDECLLAVEGNKPQAISALSAAAAGTGIEIVPIPTRYPSGGEKQLIEILTGQQVPHDRLPADIGVICVNVATVAATYRAIRFGEPLISRITTVAGEAVNSPGNFETLIGTPIQYLLDVANTDTTAMHRLVIGGPMMGFALESATAPVDKTTNCIIAATATELPDPPPAQACIRCGLCEEACPMELLPQQLLWFARAEEYEKAENLNLFDCIECGACSYVCPSSIPLVQYYRSAKGEIRHQRSEQAKAEHARARFEARQQRLEQEKADKEARRRARKEAATAVTKPAARQGQSKSAAVQAALARAQAKKGSGRQGPDEARLKDNVAHIQETIARMEAALAEAQQSEPDRVDKLEQAIARNRARLRTAETALGSTTEADSATPEKGPGAVSH